MDPLKKEIREWYIGAFPTDDLGNEIRTGITFNDLLAGMLLGYSPYTILDVHDSLVRERVFEFMEQNEVPYETIKNLWK